GSSLRHRRLSQALMMTEPCLHERTDVEYGDRRPKQSLSLLPPGNQRRDVEPRRRTACQQARRVFRVSDPPACAGPCGDIGHEIDHANLNPAAQARWTD